MREGGKKGDDQLDGRMARTMMVRWIVAFLLEEYKRGERRREMIHRHVEAGRIEMQREEVGWRLKCG